MIATEWPPFLCFYLGALLVAFSPGRWRGSLALAVPVISALLLANLELDTSISLSLMELQLVPQRVDALSLVFAWLFHIAAFLSFLFAWHLRDPVQQVAGLLYAGSALGAVFAGDLLTLFVFWEMLAVTSVFLIWTRRSERALAAGKRYLILQVLSGVLLLAGALLYSRQVGSLAFDAIDPRSVGGMLILVAFGIKCGFPLLHTWLTDAYPEATATGTVFLSAFTTKVGIYALARGFAGTEWLIYIGAIMTCFPIFYAVIENDLRRVLAYSMINQLGFMVCGIGLGTNLALAGAVAHAFNDVIFKGLLFMTMGAVLFRTGYSRATDLGGLYKSMPKTAGFCIVGAASISAFPLFSGFVSKSLIMSAMLQEHYDLIWLALLFASAGVFHHAGIKIPYFVFYAHDSGLRPREAPGNMLLAMALGSALCIGIGCYPEALYRMLPWQFDYDPFTASHVLSQLQLLFFAALAFAWLNIAGSYPPEKVSLNLDLDWSYRYFLAGLIRRAEAWLSERWRTLLGFGQPLMNAALMFGERNHGIEKLLLPKPTSGMLVWVALLLMVLVVLSNI